MLLHFLYYILTPLLTFYALLLFMRWSGILYKTKYCPRCGNKELNRIPKAFLDKLVLVITLGILPFIRYECISCLWQGTRWEKPKSQSKGK